MQGGRQDRGAATVPAAHGATHRTGRRNGSGPGGQRSRSGGSILARMSKAADSPAT